MAGYIGEIECTLEHQVVHSLVSAHSTNRKDLQQAIVRIFVPCFMTATYLVMITLPDAI